MNYNLLNSVMLLSARAGGDPAALIKNLASIIQFIGAGIGGLGVFTLVMAFREQNPSAKSSGFMELGTGLILISFANPIVDFIISFIPSF